MKGNAYLCLTKAAMVLRTKLRDMKTLNAVGFIQSFIKDLVSSLLKKGISDPAVISALVEMTSKELGLDKDLVIELIYKELYASA